MSYIKIVLTDPQDVYYICIAGLMPGQTIEGHVLLDPDGHISVKRKLYLIL